MAFLGFVGPAQPGEPQTSLGTQLLSQPGHQDDYPSFSRPHPAGVTVAAALSVGCGEVPAPCRSRLRASPPPVDFPQPHLGLLCPYEYNILTHEYNICMWLKHVNNIEGYEI